MSARRRSPSSQLDALKKDPLKVLESDVDSHGDDRMTLKAIDTSRKLEQWLKNTVDGATATSTTQDTKACVKLAILDGRNESPRKQERLILDLLPTIDIPKVAFSKSDVLRARLYPPSVNDLSIPVENRSIRQSAACLSSGVAWRFFPQTLVTVGIFWIFDDEGAEELAIVVDNLYQSSPLLHHPLPIALFYLEAMTTSMNQWLSSEKSMIEKAQIRSGFHYFDVGEPGERDASAELGELSSRTCGIAANLATSENNLRDLRAFASLIVSQIESIESPVVVDQVQFAASTDHIRRHTEYWTRECDFMIQEAVIWQHKAAIVIQGLFNLISQNDATTGLAVAEYSRSDSMSMNAIAVLTMLFLPGTFVATFLSIPTFELDPRTDILVSYEAWLYWAITMPLTFFTVVVYAVWIWVWIPRQKMVKKKSNW